jgi:hypothetical protein
MILLRLGRNYTTWESADIDEICAIAFRGVHGVDLEPSVYEIDAGGQGPTPPFVIRAHAEHAASHQETRKPTGGIDLDVTGLFDARIRVSVGDTLFHFTQSAHRELIFADAAAVRSFAVALKAHLPTRSYKVTREDLLTYAAERLSARDEEWLRARATGPLKDWKIPGH